MQFGLWHPIAEAAARAPDAAGVLQTRTEEVMDYRTGRSAMVLYACSPPGETLRGFVGAAGAARVQEASRAGARWIRFAETDAPDAEMRRLLGLFVERFGGPPIGNREP